MALVLACDFRELHWAKRIHSLKLARPLEKRGVSLKERRVRGRICTAYGLSVGDVVGRFEALLDQVVLGSHAVVDHPLVVG